MDLALAATGDGRQNRTTCFEHFSDTTHRHTRAHRFCLGCGLLITGPLATRRRND